MVARSVGDALRKAPIDVAFVGIGENGHLAFNDPPADFVTERPISSSGWTTAAAGSRWERVGSRASQTCRKLRSRCR